MLFFIFIIIVLYINIAVMTYNDLWENNDAEVQIKKSQIQGYNSKDHSQACFKMPGL